MSKVGCSMAVSNPVIRTLVRKVLKVGQSNRPASERKELSMSGGYSFLDISSPDLGKLIAFWVTILIGVVIATAMWMWRRKGSWPRCWVRFHVFPVGKGMDQTHVRIRQTLVDRKLSDLALGFLTYCKWEEDLKAEDLIWLSDPELLRVHETWLALIQRRLRRAKDAFWSAHKLAKECGFATRHRAGDYVSEADYPALVNFSRKQYV